MPRKRKAKKQTRLPSAPKAPKKKAGLKAWRTYSKNMKEWRAVCADIKSAHRAICSHPPLLPMAPRKPSGASTRRPKAKAKAKHKFPWQKKHSPAPARQFHGYGQPMYLAPPPRKKARTKAKTKRASRYGGIPFGMAPQFIGGRELYAPRASYR